MQRASQRDNSERERHTHTPARIFFSSFSFRRDDTLTPTERTEHSENSPELTTALGEILFVVSLSPSLQGGFGPAKQNGDRQMSHNQARPVKNFLDLGDDDGDV